MNHGPDVTHACWTKSSFSSDSGNCVEFAVLPGDHVGVRDSKDPDGAFLAYDKEAWRQFLAAVRTGEFRAVLR